MSKQVPFITMKCGWYSMGWRNWRGEAVTRMVKEALNKAKIDTAEIILTESKKEVPLDEGVLERSGTVVKRRNNVFISYGGGHGTGFPIVPYAIRWHETQANFQHGRKWKYLRDPFNRLIINTYNNEIQRRMGEIGL